MNGPEPAPELIKGEITLVTVDGEIREDAYRQGRRERDNSIEDSRVTQAGASEHS
jgi:hypothetical protein